MRYFREGVRPRLKDASDKSLNHERRDLIIANSLSILNSSSNCYTVYYVEESLLTEVISVVELRN